MTVETEKTLITLCQEIAGMSRVICVRVPLKEYYTIKEVSILLSVHVQRVRDMARREDDPLPLVAFPGSRKNAFVHHDDLKSWVDRNCIPYGDAHAHKAER